MFLEENHFTVHFICNSQSTSMPDFSQTLQVPLQRTVMQLRKKNPLPQLARKMRTMDMILQLNSRLLLVNHSFMLVQIVLEWKHWSITLMTEKRACGSFLAISMFVQRFWSAILLCRARH